MRLKSPWIGSLAVIPYIDVYPSEKEVKVMCWSAWLTYKTANVVQHIGHHKPNSSLASMLNIENSKGNNESLLLTEDGLVFSLSLWKQHIPALKLEYTSEKCLSQNCNHI